ncbi:hypothetical protein P152DRAFT_28584 [Eremomyces bilateralis CBS 781.70]|uniref:DUF7726 domain-containing protein n=1 Tax=Eremomyces bilateralis CBS 781.70 TaxID=1392243 RepID=A0A6G1G280_9PEZI|nr:uncharacterized protein P152DRAFT_28584 [Eremomyces bilateralis CBS 781.70]KAF1812217.1 hypothetical protein P152DRAFT_28584 [Eremomyces bilateralis CBS 781.70]
MADTSTLALLSRKDREAVQQINADNAAAPKAGAKGLKSTLGKRKSDATTDAESDDESDWDLFAAIEDIPITKTPAQVRTQIRRLIDSGELKIGEFCKKIGVSNRSYNDFIRQTRGGDNSNTYIHGLAYLQYRARKGKKITTKRPKKDVDASGKPVAVDWDVSAIHLDGEDANAVEVYDTCDEVRRKVDAQLRKPGVTQAALMRAIKAQFHPPKSLSSSSLQNFRNKRGANAGATSDVFYGAYVFFEKMRLKEGKPKSAHRQRMEQEWPRGFDLKHGSNTSYICLGDERPQIDQYGKLSIVGR